MEATMKTRRLFIVTVLFFLCAVAVAQPKPRLLDKETFMDMESVGNPEIAPDGRQIIFTRTWVDKVKDQYRSNLWIVDVDGSRVRELTSGARNDSSPVWSPDGKRIAFLSDRDGTNQLHVMWLDTREIAQLTHLEQAPNGIKWSPDGKQIAFTSFVPDNDPILPIKLPERQGGFDWSADGKTIYVSGVRKPEAEYLRNDSEIYAVDLATLEVKPLTDRRGPDGNPAVSPNGAWIAYVGYDEQMYTNHVSSLYLMDKSGGGKRVLAGNLMSSPQNVIWAADNSGV